MEAQIIAYSGAHGTGKTTSVYGMAERLKKAGVSGGNVGIILETARLCPLPVLSASCQRATEGAQRWIFARQLQAEEETCAQFGTVVSDRSLVDCIAYTRHFGYYALADTMEAMTFPVIARYRKIIFKRIIGNDFAVDDGFRDLDYTTRSRIERIMLAIYRRMGVVLFEDEETPLIDTPGTIPSFMLKTT
jgi:predicted ATPase